MIRVSVGGPWRHALARPGRAGPGRAALGRLAGVLAIEVDGIDLTGGRAEGPALAALEGLLSAVGHLIGGGLQAVVPFRDGELLLLLRRRGGDALVSLVDLGPPARLPVRGVVVDLGALGVAALEASAELCRALRELGPEASDRPARRLEALAARVEHAGATPARPPARPEPGPARCVPSGPEPVVVAVELDGDEPLALAAGERPALATLLAPGRLRLLVSGQLLAEVAALPALTLRDLVAGLEEAAQAFGRGAPVSELALGQAGRAEDVSLSLVLDRGGGEAPGASPAALPAVPLARAVVRAVEELAALAGPPQADNPTLADLRLAAASARDHLAELDAGDAAHERLAPPPRPPQGPSARPLAPGRLRHVALRPTLRVHVGEPVGPGLLAGRITVAAGRDAVVGLEPTAGRLAWRVPGATWCAGAGPLVLVRRGDVLEALVRRSGAVQWRRSLDGATPTGAAGGTRGALLLATPRALEALDPATGARRYRLEIPGADGLALAHLGEVAFVGSSSGVLYAIAPDGRIAWRLRGPGPALAAPVLVGPVLASLHAAGPGAALLLVDPERGLRRGELALDVVPSGAPIRCAGRLALGGTVGGDAALLLVSPAQERRLEVELPLTGAPHLAASGGRVVAGDASGGLALVDAAGRIAWSRPAAPGADAGGAPPWLGRGLVIAAVAEGLAAIDAGSGRTLALLAGLLSARLAVGPELGVVALEADGRATGLALGGHLSLVE